MLHCRASPFMAWICVRKTAGILEPPFSVNQFFLHLVWFVVYVVWCLWYFNIASTADVHVAEERRGERIEFS